MTLWIAALLSAAGWVGAASPAVPPEPAAPQAVFRPLQFDRRPPDVLARLGRELLAAGRYLQAEPYFLRRLELLTAKEGRATYAQKAAALEDLGDVYARESRYGDAEEAYDQAWDLLRPALGLEHPAVLALADKLGELYRRQGRWLRAEDLERRTLDARERVLGVDHPEVSDSVEHLGLLLRDEGRFTDAEALLRRALAIRSKAFGKSSAAAALSLRDLGSLYFKQRRLGEAEARYRQALALLSKRLGAVHPEAVEAMSGLAAVLRETGEPTEADALETRVSRARALLARDVPGEQP